MLVHQASQVGGLQITGTVQGQRLDTRRRHDRQGTAPAMAYVPLLEQLHIYRQADAASHACNDWATRWLRHAGSWQVHICRGEKPVSKPRRVQ